MSLFLAFRAGIGKTGLPSEIAEDFQHFMTAREWSPHFPPSFLGLKKAIVGRVVVRSHEMGDIPFREDGVKKLCFEIVFQCGNLNEIFHGGTPLTTPFILERPRFRQKKMDRRFDAGISIFSAL
jgi:hypothetical protein